MDTPWTSLISKYWTCGWLKSDIDATDAASELRLTFDRSPTNNEELCDAIRWLAGPENKQAKCPTLRELIRAVCIMRKSKRDNQHGQQPGQDVVSDVKTAMIRAREWRERWDIMCDPISTIGSKTDINNVEQDGVYRWACERWPEAADQFQRIRNRMAAEIRDAITKMRINQAA